MVVRGCELVSFGCRCGAGPFSEIKEYQVIIENRDDMLEARIKVDVRSRDQGRTGGCFPGIIFLTYSCGGCGKWVTTTTRNESKALDQARPKIILK